MRRKVIIWGCGGHAREVNFLCEISGIDVLGFLDERPEVKDLVVDGKCVLGDIHDIDAFRGKAEIVCSGVGSPALKKHFANKTIHAGHLINEPIIHPSVEISSKNIIEKGVIICAGVTMTINIHLNAHATINRNVTLGHDTRVGKYATISPGANISGNVLVGEEAFIGTGASIQEKIKIGKRSILAGGSYLRVCIPDDEVFAGVPARFIKASR